MTAKNIFIDYVFFFKNGREEVFHIELDGQSLELIGPRQERTLPWTRLDFHRCPVCTLTAKEHSNCPLAVSIAPVVDCFNNVLSYDKLRVKVTTPGRIMIADTTAQRAVGSIMGLIVAASGCPVTSFFRPMARFHLPLADEDETIYRAASMYLLAQYFLRKHGGSADLELDGLSLIYKQIQQVNMAIARRLKEASKEDSCVNAVICLDLFAKALPCAIDDSLATLRPLFSEYMKIPGLHI